MSPIRPPSCSSPPPLFFFLPPPAPPPHKPQWWVQELRDRVYNATDDRKALLAAEVSRRKAEAAAKEAAKTAATEEVLAPLLALFPGWVAKGTDGVSRQALVAGMTSFADTFRHYRKVSHQRPIHPVRCAQSLCLPACPPTRPIAYSSTYIHVYPTRPAL